jgi:hypothetical protein
LAAAVAEANASVFLREARAVKASTLAQHGTAKPFVACHWNACDCFCQGTFKRIYSYRLSLPFEAAKGNSST